MNVSLRWLGAEGFTLRVGRRMLAIDPQLALPWCDCILVSHGRAERLADVRSVARHTGAIVACSAAACTLLELLGLPARQVHAVMPGDTLSIAGFDIEVMPASRADDRLRFRVCAGHISMLTDPVGTGVAGTRADILLAGRQRRRNALTSILRTVRPRLVVGYRQEAHVRRLAGAIRAAGIAARLFVPEILRENDIRSLL